MEEKINELINELSLLDSFDLIVYYDYVSRYSKDLIKRLFDYMLNNTGNIDELYNKYFVAYIDMELENLMIDDDTYLNLVLKYGEDNVNIYFRDLLKVEYNSNKFKRKYEKIYSYIDTANVEEKDIVYNEITYQDCEDLFKVYLKEIANYQLLTKEEEVCLVSEIISLRNSIEIVSFNDYDNIIFNNLLGVFTSIKTKEQFDKFRKIASKITDEYKLEIDKYIKDKRVYFKSNYALDNGIDSIYSEDYLNNQFDKILNFINVRDKLVNSNLRLVVSIAKRYQNLGVDLMDLISEGNIGLMKSIRRFEGSKKTKISTYATWWIRQAMTRYISDHSRTVRVPVHFGDKIYKYNNAFKDLYQATGFMPTDEMIADYLDWKLEEVKDVSNVIGNFNMISLNAFVGEEEDSTFGDSIPSNDDTEGMFFKTELRELFDDCLDELSEREAMVIRYRFGFIDDREYTLEEVGKMMGVTRERIRQIESKALIKLRSRVGKKRLNGYYTLKREI